MASIFLCYRRDDSADVVGRIRERLVAKFGEDDVFVDVDAIPIGVDFQAHIDSQVRQCDVLIATIGRDWLHSADETGSRRIDSHDDFVRVEIASALNRNIPIIPVLVRGAEMPSADSLPVELKPLATRNGISVRPDPDFNHDMSRLLAGIGDHLSGRTAQSPANDYSADSEDERVIGQLRQLRSNPDIRSLPFIFDCLAHENEGIQTRAAQVVQKLGWPIITLQMERVVKSSSAADIDRLLNGAAAVEATTESVNVLARLCDLLSGSHRLRAFSLIQRKRLALQMSTIANLFDEHDSSYDIERALGQGLFTASYLARHRQTDDYAVIRVLLDDFLDNDDIRTKMLALWRRSTRYVHESLVLTRDVSQFGGKRVYFCVRDYFDGETLQHHLHAGRHFDNREIVSILRNVALALSPIHARGEVHGGVKPSNIFLGPDDSVRLGDTSLPVTLTRATENRLSVDYPYVSPETFDVSGSQVPQSDYYSLVCVAFELISGSPPFIADSEFTFAHLHKTAEIPTVLRHGTPLSSAGQTVISTLMSKAPQDRPGSPDEVCELLETLEENLGGDVAAPPAEQPVPRAVRADVTSWTMPEPSELDADRTILPHFAGNSADREDPLGIENVQEARRSSSGRDRELKVGDVIKDRFELVELLGQGGMGTVFKALDMRRVEAKDRSPHVAVKVLNEHFKQHPDSLIALQRETRKAQDLAHPNIVTTFDFDRDGDTVYMTMELLEGKPLDQFLRDQRGSGVDLVEALPIIDGMSNALSYAHGKNIVHSDFKPGNCYLTETGTVKVLDFGIARAASHQVGKDSPATIFDPATLAGITPAYATAEQINNQLPDELDDIYALSCIAYELLTGRHPYDRLDGASARQRSLTPRPIKDVPSRINRAILRGLALDRAKRTNTVLQFKKDMQPNLLQRWLGSLDR